MRLLHKVFGLCILSTELAQMKQEEYWQEKSGGSFSSGREACKVGQKQPKKRNQKDKQLHSEAVSRNMNKYIYNHMSESKGNAAESNNTPRFYNDCHWRKPFSHGAVGFLNWGTVPFLMCLGADD